MASKSTGSASKYLKVPISLPSVEDDDEDEEEEEEDDNNSDDRVDNEGIYVTGMEKKVRNVEEEVENIDEKSQGREDDELVGEEEKKENSYGGLD